MNEEIKDRKIIRSYNMVNKFDKNQKNRIKNLLKLNGICIFHHQILCQSTEINEKEGCSSFFSTLVDISNIVLTWQIFDEISASLDNRGPLEELINEVKSEAIEDEDENLVFIYELAFQDLSFRTFKPELMYTDFIIGSMFQDFIVGTYSAFEYWLTVIYDNIFQSSSAIEKRKEKIIKMISKRASTILDEDERNLIEGWLVKVQDEISSDIIKKFGSYISSAEKIDTVFSHANKIYNKNLKDLGVDPIDQEDRNLVKFYAAQRNSIHNLGVHSKSLDTSFYGVEIEAGKPSYYENYSDNINLCLDLVKVFIKIIGILEADHNLLIKMN